MKQDEIDKLKKMSLDRYVEDHGVMYECWELEDYVEAIEKDKTAEAAWKFHVTCVEAMRETQACYDTGEF